MKYTSLCLVGLLAAGGASAASVRSPSGVANSSTRAPFFVDSRVAPSVRYQQVYRESDFQGSGGLQLLITEIGFSGDPYTVDLASIEVWFSSTTRHEGDLSSVFSENPGSDAMLAYSGPLHFDNDGSQTYGFRIQLETPFLYNRQAGNLLMEVRNYQTTTFPVGPGVPQPFMASNDRVGDGTASVVSFDVNSPTAEFFRTDGLSTVFVVEPIPEPGAVLLFAVSALVGCPLILLRRRRNNRSKAE